MKRRIKIKPNRELLDLHIGTMPHDELLEFFNITDIQYNQILFDKPVKQLYSSGVSKAYLNPEKDEDIEPIEPPPSVELSPEYIEEITQFYLDNIEKYNVRPEVIDSQSYTKGDYFMNQLLKMMSTNVIQSKKECGASVRNAIIDSKRKGYNQKKYQLNNSKKSMFIANSFEDLIDCKSIQNIMKKYDVNT
ncbi:hypothetical protein [Carboxylicivirga sp. M1479]|uniref:hypothetical protein n=1 Tax=Carboxylicivirga sp. M1479 TaxID=2594476 RepID=UPI001177B952|nr:hypothetical protein [Carboxylicivirga sp. M1479]TRX71518.1 hypothetical protein FNN09_05985 [Carboxylicivirga sp. M1479]